MIFGLLSAVTLRVNASEISKNEYYVKESRAVYLPFSMVAAEVHDYVNTATSGKSFNTDHVTRVMVNTYGKLFSTATNGQYQAGVCYYDSVMKKYLPVSGLSDTKTSGQMFNKAVNVLSLTPGVEYFAFADNLASNTYYIHGTVSVDHY